MNRLVFKNLVLLAIGAGTGAGLANYFLKDKYIRYANEEIQSMEEYYESHYSYNPPVRDVSLTFEDVEISREDDSPIIDPADKINYHRIAKNYTTMNNKQDIETVLRDRGLKPVVDESKLSKVYREDYPPEDKPEEDDEFETQPIMDMDTSNKNIYVIDDITFSETATNHEKLSLTYYEGDGVLTDERDDVIPDVIGLLGDSALNEFGAWGNDDHVIYVRNNRIGADFEITKMDTTYAEVVLGVNADPKPKVEAKTKPTTQRKKRVVEDGEN